MSDILDWPEIVQEIEERLQTQVTGLADRLYAAEKRIEELEKPMGMTDEELGDLYKELLLKEVRRRIRDLEEKEPRRRRID